jgi:hypothetical protein
MMGIVTLVACSADESEEAVAVHDNVLIGRDPSSSTVATEVTYQGPYLVFEFPDGNRGGFGRFVGANYGTKERRKTKDCGLINPVGMTHWSHSSHLVTRSTSQDREIVDCLLRTSGRHFNIYYTDDASLRDLRRGEMPFQELMNNPDRQRPNSEK